MDSHIETIDARPILNSRGEWTLEVTLTLSDGTKGIASVPEGKSKGSHEVVSLDAFQAVQSVKLLIHEILSETKIIDQEQFDEILISLDGTADKSHLGGNAMLGVSLAYARAMAGVHNVSLWRYLHALSNASVKLTFPRLWVNVINGGMHAGNELGIQEYLISPRTRDIGKSVRLVQRVYKELGNMLAEHYGSVSTLIGDEGGYAPKMKDDEEPVRILKELIGSKEFVHTCDLGIDAAGYPHKRNNEKRKLYRKLCNQYELAYVEDPFNEDEPELFTDLREQIQGCMVIGDDLTVTNAGKIKTAVKEKTIDGVIIKPNQIGTLTETLSAIHTAQYNELKVIISHRSGETNDAFIADLAVAVGADGIKLGAPARGERVAKYNRLLEIQREIDLV